MRILLGSGEQCSRILVVQPSQQRCPVTSRDEDGVVGLLGQQRVIGGDRLVEPLGVHELLGLDRARVRANGFLAARLDRHRLRATDHATGRRGLSHLVGDLTELLLVDRALGQRCQLSTDDGDEHRNGLNAQALGQLRLGVDVDVHQQPLAGSLVGNSTQHLRHLLGTMGLRCRELHQHRVLHRLLEQRVEILLGTLDHPGPGGSRTSWGGSGRRVGGTGCGCQPRQIDGIMTMNRVRRHVVHSTRPLVIRPSIGDYRWSERPDSSRGPAAVLRPVREWPHGS